MGLIKIKNVCKSYETNHVLSNVSMTVKNGDFIVLYGKSGIGKSVLLRLILGIEKPDSGSLEINQTKPNIGILFQQGALFDSMSIYENVAFPLHAQNMYAGRNHSSDYIHEQTMNALEEVGLHEWLNKLPDQLSGGMQRRAAIARLMTQSPDIMLFDEPTSGLDPITSASITQYIEKLKKRKKTTSILVTHDIDSGLKLGNRFYFLDEKKLIFSGIKKKLMESKNPTIQAFLGKIRR